MISTSVAPQMPCCGGHTTPNAANLLSSGLTNSASEKPLSESSSSSCPRISGSVAEFWDWLEDAANGEWAAMAFPVERGYSDRNIFVTKLPPAFDDRDLQTMFGYFGVVVSAKVMLNVSTGASKGTGFVQLASAKDALRARAFLRLRPAVTEPVMPEVGTQWALNKHDGGVYGDRSRMARKLFLRNIPVSVTSEEMRCLVTKFGDVAEVTLHADTYDATAAAAHNATTRSRDSGEDEEEGAGGADKATTAAATAANTSATTTPPVSPHKSLRICFVTFQQPGVAAKACAALHNTKPFRACGDIPVMAKIAEDNNARQARHQQGALCRSSQSTAASSPHAGNGSQRSPMRSGNRRNSNQSTMMMMHNTAWSTSPSDAMPYPNNGGAGMPAAPTMLQPGYQQDPAYHTYSPASHQAYHNHNIGGNGAQRSFPLNAPTAAPVAIVGGFGRLTFSPQNPYAAGAAVSAPDPTALNTTGTPRALSTTASPTMKLPVVQGTERVIAAAADSRRSSRLALTMSSSMSSSKARIPGTTTSAPTSARRASRDRQTRSPLFGRGGETARAPSSVLCNSASVSGVYSAEVLTSPSLSTLPQSQTTAPLTRAAGTTPAAVAVPVSPRAPAHMPVAASSHSSESAGSHRSRSLEATGRLHHFSNSISNGNSNSINASATRTRRVESAGSAPRRSGTTVVRVSPQMSPHMSAQVALRPSPGFGMSPTPRMVVAPLSLSRAAWEAAAVQDGALVSPYASPLSGSHTTPTRGGASPQARYRNNPYGMSIVLEKTRSTSFAEA